MSHFIVRDHVAEGCDYPNDGAVCIADPLGTSDDKVLLTTSDVAGSTIYLDVFEQGDDTPVYSTTLAKGDVISNTPIDWQLDRIGRNFRHYVHQADVGAGVLKGGRDYEFVYRIPTNNDGVLRCVFIWVVDSMEV